MNNECCRPEEETKNHQQRDDISKLKEKIKSAYYQATKIEINTRPGQQIMLKIREIVKMLMEQ